MSKQLEAGVRLVTAECGEAGLAQFLLDFIEQNIPYRSDGDEIDRANWATVRGLREVKNGSKTRKSI